jgi:cyanophycin synthetase
MLISSFRRPLAWAYASSYVEFRWRRWSDRDSRTNERATNEFYRRMWQSAAAVLGAEFIELSDGFFEIRLGARSTRVHQSLLMLDHPVSLRLATRKPLVHRLLTEMNLPVAPHCAYDLAHLERARAFLESAPGACVVKPARDSGAGDGVTTNVETVRDLTRASIYASFFQRELMIERQIAGTSYRLLYLDGRLIDAIRRRPPTLVGDGRSTVRELVAAESHAATRRVVAR